MDAPQDRGPLAHLERALAVVAAAVLGWMAVSISVAVVSRHLLNRPLAWTFELAEFSLLAVAFLALAYVGREDGHVRMELLGELLPDRYVRVISVFAELFSALVLGVAFVAAALITYSSYQSGAGTTGVLRVERWLILMLIPVGFGLLGLEHGRRLHATLRRGSGSPATDRDTPREA